jgi:hypothetical protein
VAALGADAALDVEEQVSIFFLKKIKINKLGTQAALDAEEQV